MVVALGVLVQRLCFVFCVILWLWLACGFGVSCLFML